ncbi:MAG TPA: hydrogenase nickel incorporation protein HypB [Vicinamibacterales bacterium]|nr:hydrogenase nickel incorporation protein HypB [Vicinamibacterales bacterium]
MCETCGCGDPHLVSVDVQERVLSENDRQAVHNREHFAAAGVTVLNLMGSPGAGKTAVLEATARRLGGRRQLGAIAGDLATDHDAARLERAGVPARSISTGSACHLDAAMVHRALHHMNWSGLDYLFIENVGNLVCPAVYDLGEHANVVALSVTEGEDKPLKYPVMFKKVDLVLLTKVDLLPHLPGISVDRIWDALQHVMPGPRMLRLSATTGEGIDEWVGWLEERRAGRLGSTSPPPPRPSGLR